MRGTLVICRSKGTTRVIEIARYDSWTMLYSYGQKYQI